MGREFSNQKINRMTLLNLGIKLANQGNSTQAANVFRQVIKHNPPSPEAYYNLGTVLSDSGLLSEAADMFRQAIKLNPNHPKFYNNLGIVLEKANLLNQAAELFGWAIKLDPGYIEALNNLGTIFIRTSQFAKAKDCLQQVIKLNPAYAKAYNNLGLVLENTNHRLEALQCFQQAIELEPNDPALYNNLGKMLKESRQLKEAEACFKKALVLRPDFVDADFSLAILYLLQEHYEEGWEKYDDLRLLKNSDRYLPVPHWRGENLTGCHILLYADQGLGDTIHFSRYVQRVASLASKTSLLVQKPLTRLLGFSLNDCQIITNNDPVVTKQFDYACPLLRLPHIFHTSRDTIPHKVPYLQSNPIHAASWHKVFNRIDKGKLNRIGIVWAGNPAHNNDRNRSIPFAIFASLFDIAEVTWISLQVGNRVDDLATTTNSVINISDRLIDFAETAGVIANLDLVITVDSSVAHLSGAMGQRTWLLLPFNPDWRWQLDRQDSPWYPTMRLFRQYKMDSWAEVLSQVKKTLRAFLSSL